MVVVAVKLIYWTGFGNDVVNGSGIMESILNSIKPLHVVVDYHTSKLHVSCQYLSFTSTFDEIIKETSQLGISYSFFKKPF
jgi:hypothetical protein